MKLPPAPQPATAPALQPISLWEGIYLARFDRRTTVTVDGLLRCVRTDNKSYGRNDIDSKGERVEVRQGQLITAQMAKLAAVFSPVARLPESSCGGVADGPEVDLHYGNMVVRGGSDIPPQARNAMQVLAEMTAAMPLADK